MAKRDRKFITAVECAAILCCDPKIFRDRYASRITTLALPGAVPRYLRTDVETFRDTHLVKPSRELAEVRP